MKETKIETVRRLLSEAPEHKVLISEACAVTGGSVNSISALLTHARYHPDPAKRFSAVRRGEYIQFGEPDPERVQNAKGGRGKYGSKAPMMNENGHLDLRFSALRGICARQPELLPGIIAQIDQVILKSLV